MHRILTDIFPGTTVYVEWIITKLVVRVRRLKKESIGTKFFLGNFSDAFVIFITLFWIWEESIWFRTKEVS